ALGGDRAHARTPSSSRALCTAWTAPVCAGDQGLAAVPAAEVPTGDVKPSAVTGGLGGGDEKKIEEAAELARKAMEKSLDEMLGTGGAGDAAGAPGLEGAGVAPAVKKDEAAGGGGAGVSADLRDTVVTRGDGSKLIDGRFVVRGKGTEAEPYRVPWEMLASVQETYSPRKGLKKIPERIKFLDGKWVKLSGFIAFPITSNDPKGLLVMLNQWDGCCIGVPPTPYDSVEVYLADRATAAQRASAQGSVYGRLKVDPIDDDGWVIGVYVIQGGRLVTEE
ncbi:MAG: hypothetical protein IBJ18_14390, partial [Phycisphaerales bacterium]|nr:hypothetical protein [Phycisphaerales bacterium]